MSKKAPTTNLTTEESAFDLIGPSFKGFWLNLVPFLFVTLASLATVMLAAKYQYDFSQLMKGEQLDKMSDPGGFALWMLAIAVVSFVTYVMEVHISLKSAGMKQTDIGESLRVTGRYLFRLIGFCIVFGLLFVLGLLLLIVPALFVIKYFVLSPYYIIDKDMPVLEAMKQSAKDSGSPFNMLLWGVIGITVVFIILAAILGQLIPAWAIGTILGSLLTSAYGVAFPIRYLQIQNGVFEKSK